MHFIRSPIALTSAERSHYWRVRMKGYIIHYLFDEHFCYQYNKTLYGMRKLIHLNNVTLNLSFIFW